MVKPQNANAVNQTEVVKLLVIVVDKKENMGIKL